MIGNTFRTGEPLLHNLLDRVQRGVVQLPDFQRKWVWDDARIQRLLASVSLARPIGAAMLLEAGGDEAQFAPRLVTGVKLPGPTPTPEHLILDGQQRLTSLFLALKSDEPVETFTEKKEPIRRYYYLDIRKCLDPEVDRVDAILALPEERKLFSDFKRKVELDVSTAEREYALGLLPVRLVYDQIGFAGWRQGYEKFHNYAAQKLAEWSEFERQVWLPFQQFKLPVIELLKGTPKEAVCEVFENVNTGGVALTVFELMTATYAASNFKLRDDWEARKKRLEDKHELLADLSETEFLQAVTLLATCRRSAEGKGAVGCKRKDILRLGLDEYKACAPEIEAGLDRAARLLMREKVFLTKNLPYQTQFVPLSAICALIGERYDVDTTKKKLAQWYWCGVFGELYGGASESRFALDVQQVPAWLEGGPEPRTISDSSFSPVRLLTLQTRLSAAYKGLMARLMLSGSLDFISGEPIQFTTYMEDSVDIHHIFPADYCEKAKLDRKYWNSVINKGPLTASTNRRIGGKAPSKYLSPVDEKLGAARVNEIVATHLVDPSLLRADDFHGHVRFRAARLLDAIEKATGKAVTGRDSDEVVREFGGALA